MKLRILCAFAPLREFIVGILAVALWLAGALTVGAQDKPPYPQSPVIASVEWAPVDSIIRTAKGGDNWPMTWGADDWLYTSYGDAWGFEPFVEKKLSMGFSRVAGTPPNIRGENIRTETGEAVGQGPAGRKASGILFLPDTLTPTLSQREREQTTGTLYVLVRNVGNSQLGWSNDQGKTWQWADWKFDVSFGCPTILNFGKAYFGARDSYVYIYSQDRDSAYERADRMVLARVPKDRMRERAAYEFFARRKADGSAEWTPDAKQRGGVFEWPGQCYRSSVTYNAGLKRYLWSQTGPGEDTRFAGGFGIYDAPEPWGPWTTVYFTAKWDVGPGETSSLPTKWMSADGKTVHLVFSGDDYFSVRKGTLK